MTNKKDEVERIQGRLTVVQRLWDYERTQILKALGITGDINPKAWSTETLIDEIKDCIEGHKMLAGEGDPNPLYRDNVLQLEHNDPELQRAWQRFPDRVADCHGFTWEYLATELIHEQWVHVFIHELHPIELRPVYTRVPASPGWNPTP